MSGRALVLFALFCSLLAGCYEESIPERNLDGELVIAGDLVNDPRDAGMIYIGIYEGFDWLTKAVCDKK